MIIEKKVWTEYFEKLLSGEKTFDVRLADFEASVGDTLLLKEWDPNSKKYTGREIKKEITYISNIKSMEKFHTKEEIEKYSFQVFGFK